MESFQIDGFWHAGVLCVFVSKIYFYTVYVSDVQSKISCLLLIEKENPHAIKVQSTHACKTQTLSGITSK